MYISKYAPKTFDDLSFSPTTTHVLQSFAEYGRNALIKYKDKCINGVGSVDSVESIGYDGIMNMFVYGIAGCGKRCRVMIMLNEIFKDYTKEDNYIYNLTAQHYTLKYKGNKKYEYMIRSSNYHIELDLSIYRTNDFYVLVDFLKMIESTKNIYTNSYRIVVVYKAHLLSKKAQLYLRRTIETNMENIRFIFVANTICGIQKPLLSRCALVKVSPPTIQQVNKIMENIIINESLTLPKTKKTRDKILTKIIDETRTNGILINLREAIRMMQMSFMGQDNTFMYFRNPVDKLIDNIFKLKSKKVESKITNTRYQKIREIIYMLYSANIDMDDVVKRIMKRQLRLINTKLVNNSNDDNDDNNSINITNNITINVLKKRIIDDTAEISYMFIKGKHSMVSLEYYLLKLINGNYDFVEI